MHRNGFHADIRRLEPAQSERLGDHPIIPEVAMGEDPSFLAQFGDIDLASTRPRGLTPDDDDQLVVKKRVDIHVCHLLRLVERPTAAAGKYHVEIPIPELLSERRRVHRVDVEDNSGILFGEPLDNGLKDCGRNGFRTPYSNFADRRIGQELDIPYALPQFIEGRDAALVER